MKGSCVQRHLKHPIPTRCLVGEDISSIICHLGSLRAWRLRQKGQGEMESCSWLLCFEELSLELPATVGDQHDAEHAEHGRPVTQRL